MFISFAPLEGITTYTYRNLHKKTFGGADQYYAPFIAPDGVGKFKDSALKDVLPENNRDINLVPQILCNKAEAFLAVAEKLHTLGYKEVNLNAGCASGTVVPKHKGAGMLIDLDSLDAFLNEVFSHCPIKVSVKTRMGVESTEEFPAILDIYNKYPLSKLIIHTRDKAGKYISKPDIEMFIKCFPNSKNPTEYNGDIFSSKHLSSLQARLPGLSSVMTGRGAIANPALPRQLKGGKALEKAEFIQFHDELMAEYLSSGLDEHFTLGRLKEIWYYGAYMFPDSKKAMKQIYKSRCIADYKSAASILFANEVFDPDSYFTAGD